MVRLITVKAFNTPIEADCARILLEAAGIPAQLADEALVGNFWQYGTAVGGVKLQVDEVDWEQARVLIETAADARNSRSTGEWTCPKCEATVDADFETCWQCGTSRAGVEDPDFEPDLADDPELPAAESRDVEANDVEIRDADVSAVRDELGSRRIADGNPYASPHVRFDRKPDSAEEPNAAEDDEADYPGDDMARRAMTAGVFGLTVLPVVWNLVSLVMLVRLDATNLPLSARGRKHRRQAWTLNLMVAAGWAAWFGIAMLSARF